MKLARFSILPALLAAGVAAATFAPPAGAKPPQAAQVREQFEFELRELKVEHQGGNVLTLKVRYDYRPGLRVEDYPDFRRLAKTCEDFFPGYPNRTDFWEILNRKLAGKLLHDFPSLAAVTVEIRVAPTETIPYARASTVTVTR